MFLCFGKQIIIFLYTANERVDTIIDFRFIDIDKHKHITSIRNNKITFDNVTIREQLCSAK